MKFSAQPETRTIAAGEFKAKCLQLMDEVQQGNLTLIVTKRGKPVMQATAPMAEAKTFVPLWGLTPNIKVNDDLLSPLFTDEEMDSFGNLFPNE